MGPDGMQLDVLAAAQGLVEPEQRAVAELPGSAQAALRELLRGRGGYDARAADIVLAFSSRAGSRSPT
eukprot:8283177-Lingulodinium_polyedra.AAC.1